MRIATLLPLLVVTPLAYAQTFPGDASEERFKSAYQNVRVGTEYVYELTGSDSYGRVTRPLHAFLYLRMGLDPRTGGDSAAWVELDVYETKKDGTERMAMRIVGDGTTLYRYDLDRGEVAATTYGFYGTQPPRDYSGSDMTKLIAQLRTATPGPAAYLVRLLAELNPRTPTYSSGNHLPETQRFAQWLPGRQGATIEVKENEKRNVVYGFEDPNPKQIVSFIMEKGRDENDGAWRFTSLYFTQKSADRTLDFSLTTGLGVPTWAFLPYTGADAARFRPVNPGGH